MSQALALIIFLIGFIRITGQYVGWETNIDLLLFRDKLPVPYPPYVNQMAISAAINFIACGISLFLLAGYQEKYFLPAQTLVFYVMLISLSSLEGFLFQINHLYGIEKYMRVALLTAVFFLLLSSGILFIYPHRGYLGVITSLNSGGTIGRQLLPVAVMFPLLPGQLACCCSGSTTMIRKLRLA